MASLQDLLKQREDIDRQIEETRKAERAKAMQQIRALMSEFGITASDMTTKAAPKGKSATTKKAAIKYRNTATGDTWSGRGLQPRWLKAALAQGAKLGDFVV